MARRFGSENVTMNISELRKRTQQQIVGGDWNVPQALQDWLEKNGFEMVASGFFSKVFAQPGSNKIVKILGAKNASETTCGAEFAKFQRRTNSKHFPKVFAVKTYKEAGYDFPPASEKITPQPMTVIIMENIPHPFDGKKIRWKRDKVYNMGLGAFLLRHIIISPIDIVDREEYFPADWRDRVDGSYSNEETNRNEIEWFARYRNDPVVLAIQTIFSLTRKHNCLFADFKYENTRMREDGTIVFIDALPF